MSKKKDITNSELRIAISKNNLKYNQKFFDRDSSLYADQVIAETDLDQTRLNYLNSKDNFQNVNSAEINAQKDAKQTQTQINQTEIQKVRN